MTERVLTIDGKQFELRVERAGSKFRAGQVEIELLSAREGEAEVRFGARTYFVPYAMTGTEISFAFDGEVYMADIADAMGRRSRHRDHSMSAPMPGLVLKIFVKPGDVVAKGAPLLVLEAMKMEHQIVAPHDGTVAAVNCTEGEMVQVGVDLVEVS